MIRNRDPQTVHPSTMAACSISRGIASMNPIIIQRIKGRVKIKCEVTKAK